MLPVEQLAERDFIDDLKDENMLDDLILRGRMFQTDGVAKEKDP